MADPTPKPKLESHQLVNAVVARHAPPEWWNEVEMTLGNRRLDLVCFNLWGARGYRVEGFEIKVDRGDWLRELANVQKADEWVKVVDYFYVVTPPGLIRKDELPTGWGHLELVGDRMMKRAEPMKREEGHHLPREIIARFLSRSAAREQHQLREAEGRARAEVWREIDKQVAERTEQNTARLREKYEQTEKDHLALMKALGIRTSEYGALELALRAATILARHEKDAVLLANSIRHTAERVGEQHRVILEAAKTLEPEKKADG